MLSDAGYDLRDRARNISAAVGQGAHAAAALDLSAICDQVDRPKFSDTEERGIQAFRESAEGEIETDALTPDRNTGESQIRQIARYHYEVIAPFSRPVRVESRLSVRIGSAILSGQPDSIETDGTIRDIKTGRRNNVFFQLAGYSMIARAHEIPISGGEVIGLPRPKKRAEIEEYRDRIHGPDLAGFGNSVVMGLIADIQNEASRIMAGEPCTRLNPSGVLCSPKFCPAYGTNFCGVTHGR